MNRRELQKRKEGRRKVNSQKIPFKVLLMMFAPYKTVQMQIAAISAFLKKIGCEVRYLEIDIYPGDDSNKFNHYIRQEIEAFQPYLVGLSSYDMNYYFNLNAADFIKKNFPEIKIIVGGHHASAAPEDYTTCSSIDFVCIGEGEYVLKDLIEALREGGDTNLISGLCLRDESGRMKRNAARPLIENLDELPFLDRSIVHSRQLEINYLPILAGKGCPFQCTYCANEIMKNLYPNRDHYLRYRSPERIIQEINMWKKIYNFQYIYFYDDIFAMDYEWLKEFTELYVKHFPTLPYYCLLHPSLATDEKRVVLLSKSGCKNISMGVESGSEVYRKKMLRREMTNKTILKAARTIKRNHVNLSIYMMVGLPGETLLDMLKSLWLNIRIGANGVQTGIYYPIKNTPLYKYCLEHNFINEERKKEIFIYTYNTCLNCGVLKRGLIILFKWLNSGVPILCKLQLRLIPQFLRIQYRKVLLRRIDYK